MALFKCKMCGGNIEFNPGDATGTCDSCGSVQTLPKGNDEVINNLFNRANNLRLKSEFDKAAEIYERILNENNSDAEAHWGLVLCKYGIEYVEDPATYKRIPTCHRAQYESILTDADYITALENSDTSQQSLLTQQAIEISNIQKGILAIVNEEKPFDVFICYKETDENGKRTVDSALANDIYYQLTQEGLKVFYAAITLEDKLGQEYEPYIFAALHSAKVMLVVGTKPEYFEAVWVRNEWSRFLKLMKTDRTKLLIPCYRDMDAYDLPEEFAHLQAQDMSKIGFVNDVVRGIKKVIGEGDNGTAKETVVVASESAASVAPLLKRAYMFLEDYKWKEADEYCEKVLDLEPENAEAYLGKLMAEVHVSNIDDLKHAYEPFDESDNAIKASRFDSVIAEKLKVCNEFIRERNENARKEKIYNEATEILNSAIKEDEYTKAKKLFETISGFKDADGKAQKCAENAEKAHEEAEFTQKEQLYNKAVSSMNSAKSEKEFKESAYLFDRISGFKDSDELLSQCLEKAETAKAEEEIREAARKDEIYNRALNECEYDLIDYYDRAIKLFNSIVDWKDSRAKIEECDQRIKEIKAAEEEKARVDQKRIEEEVSKKVRKANIIYDIMLALYALIPPIFQIIFRNLDFYRDEFSIFSLIFVCVFAMIFIIYIVRIRNYKIKLPMKWLIISGIISLILICVFVSAEKGGLCLSIFSIVGYVIFYPVQGVSQTWDEK
ncbi:MAG: TIR domain-containing protein [Clostridiales bacterium]|nr:TIR domain-containing protein [Clostridiales bacterium]